MAESIIRARVPEEIKTAFDRACAANDLTASQVLRRLMREYVSNQETQGQLFETPSKKKQKISARTWRILRENGITTEEQLKEKTSVDLLGIQFLGKQKIKEIEAVVTLKPYIPKY